MLRRLLVQALGGTLAGPESDLPEQSPKPSAVTAAPPPSRSLAARVRAAIGSAFLAGFALVTPQTQRAVRIAEALGGSLLGDRGTVNQNEDIGFRPISERAGGKRTRDLTIISHREMINVALYLYGSNALAEWLVDMPVSLVVGQEIGYTIAIAADKAVAAGKLDTPEEAAELTSRIREILDKFWYHPAHNVSEKAPEYARTFLVTGHLVLPITAVNEVDGTPQFDLVDASQITGVNPAGFGTGQQSAIVPGWVRFTPIDAGAVSAAEKAYKVLQQNPDGLFVPEAPGADGALANMEGPEGAKVVGECLYFRYNKLLNSMRGVSYLTPVADWVDALDQFTWATLDRAKLRNAIVWHLQLQNVSDPEKLKEQTEKLMTALVKPGSVYTTNEQTTLEAKNANLGAAESVELGRMILTHILGSKGFPESWFSHGGGTNRATAGVQTDVAYKALLGLQMRFRSIFRAMLWTAYDSAQAKQPGALPKRTESPWLTLEPIMPVVQERDVSRLAASCAQMAAGLEAAIAANLISERTGRRTFLDLMGQMTGGAYELDEEEAQIETEKQDAQDDAAAKAQDAYKQALAGADPPGDGGGVVDPVPAPDPYP
jgi:hypothetical protein